MKASAKILGLLALFLTIVPPVLNATGTVEDAAMKSIMLAGAVLWFCTAPFWLRHGDG